MMPSWVKKEARSQALLGAGGFWIRSTAHMLSFITCRFTGVMIGLEVEAEPLLGVVHLPALNESIYAARGLGCFWNDKPARVSSTSDLDFRIAVGDGVRRARSRQISLGLEDLRHKANASRTWGDCYGHDARRYRPRGSHARSGYEYLGLRGASSDN